MVITDLRSCIDHIQEARQQPHSDLGSIALPGHVIDRIRDELKALQPIKDSPRPTYGPPWGNVDRLLWDALQEEMKRSRTMIMGVELIRTP